MPQSDPPQMIFVNLPVRDLAASRRFLESLGATNEPRFSDDTAAMMRFSDSVNFMLLTHEKWRQFTSLPIVDARSAAQVLLCLSRTSRGDVDQSVAAGVTAGGTADPTPKQDYGGMMYGRSVTDPDGHIFELMWMAPQAAEQGVAAMAETEGVEA